RRIRHETRGLLDRPETPVLPGAVLGMELLPGDRDASGCHEGTTQSEGGGQGGEALRDETAARSFLCDDAGDLAQRRTQEILPGSRLGFLVLEAYEAMAPIEAQGRAGSLRRFLSSVERERQRRAGRQC